VSTRIVFHRLAELELNDAAQYYNSESPGLGSTFLEIIQAATSKIGEFPESGHILQGQVRRYLVRGFPYGLLYSGDADEIRILAVMNLKRRPFYWTDRS
jgi:toxin ParE1/3/4